MSAFGRWDWRTAGVCLALGLLIGPAAWGQEDEHDYSGADVYRLFCILCHGPRGQGSPLGTPLIRGNVLALTDQQIFDVVYNGRADKGMMAFGTGLTKGEIDRLTQYVRELQGRSSRARPSTSSGGTTAAGADRAQLRSGEELFAGKAGCAQCHSYYTRGGQIGPALDKVAARLTVEELHKAVVSPSDTIVENYGGKEIVTEQGTALRGRFRYETEETLQLQNAEATLWTTYFKSDLRSVQDLEQSLMPANLIEKLSADEQEALFAFLTSLK